MKKELHEQVWPVVNYTDKIHTGIKMMFQMYPWLSFTIPQMQQHLIKGYPWLNNPNERQQALLSKIIKTGIQKLIQLDKVKKVSANTSVEPQWQAASAVAESGYANVTSEDDVAHTEAAQKLVGRRAANRKKLFKLNNLNPNDVQGA